RPRKGKTQSESLFFSRLLRGHEGATGRETRITTELGMLVQDAFDALLIMNLGRLPSWLCTAEALILVLPFSLTGCNGRCLTTPKLRLWDAAKWVTRCA